jgi:SET domain-containing protein
MTASSSVVIIKMKEVIRTSKCSNDMRDSMKDHIIKQIGNKGFGVFALRNFKKGEHIFYVDLTKLKRYTVREIDENSDLNGDHSDYVGHGKYVVNHSPASYMNHSCDPNCYVKMRKIAIKDVYALRDI